MKIAEEKCQKCAKCIPFCPMGAISLKEKNSYRTRRMR
ncbi:MAG: 4Fe-4S binding protein [Thermodesulfobacteriota bacterium]